MARQPLGRGLNAILGGGVAAGAGAASVDSTDEAQTRSVESSPAARPAEDSRRAEGAPLLVPIEQVVAGRGQPRRHFDDSALEELAASIREQGILQPLVVSRGKGCFELIAGERRLRAAGRAGLERVPVVVRDTDEEVDLLELALVENLQREDLSPLERARAYERLIDTHGHTQEEIARRVGKSRTAVANTLRLLGLPQPILDGVDEGLLSEGHARALLGLDGVRAQVELMRQIVRRGLSVRQTEELVKGGSAAKTTPKSNPERPSESALEQGLRRRFGTKVRLRGTEKKGRIEIEFYSAEELTRLIDMLSR